jgi:hypothetical protein
MDRDQRLNTIHPYLLAINGIVVCLIVTRTNEAVQTTEGFALCNESKREMVPQAQLSQSVSGTAASYNPHLGNIRPEMTHP